jgi:hypothetical protein
MQVGLASGRALINERAWSVSGAYIQLSIGVKRLLKRLHVATLKRLKIVLATA